jgi:hypothetical protein
MAGQDKYDWPPIEGLIAFSQKHGVKEAAVKLGVPEATLRARFNRFRIPATVYAPPKRMNEDALEEIRALIDK